MENISREINLNQLSRNASDEALHLHLTELVALVIQMIITTTACPFTILLNILVILAVKKTPRLQSKANILLACLAATDAFIGLTAQPSSILVELFRLIDMKSLALIIRDYIHSGALLAGIANSLLHLMLVTFERLVAIKFTTHHPFLMTEKNIKVSVAIFWIIALCIWALRCAAPFAMVFTVGPLVPSCIIFIAISYVILYRETLRHRKRIKTEQIAQQEVEMFLKENKALKTTVYVVGSLVLCFIPSSIVFLSYVVEGLSLKNSVYFVSFSRVLMMLNSLLNPLIYFWRDKEMRKLVSPYHRSRDGIVVRTLAFHQ
ncbi:lysophosphatidic acid receptor 3-like [Acropora palmata]|uniref:lysophosphatidic acid receptor 3-like n=1 Tax=Acropora palmata TaxID=6131 RepID=UPI003D9FD31C